MATSMKKTVWLLNHYAQTPEAPGGTRHYWLSRYLQESGWSAPIAASSLELNTGRERLNPGESRRLEEIHGVPFLWLRTPPFQGNGLGRVRNMAAFALRLQEMETIRLLPRPDAIVGSSVHPLTGWAGLRLARRFQVPFLFEVRDLWPETLINFGTIGRNSLPAVAMRRLEGTLYRNAARVVTLLPEAWRYIERFGVKRERVVWIPNGVALDRFPYRPPAEIGGRLNLLYFGAHGQANGLDTLLQAMAILKREHPVLGVRLRLVGDGPLKPALRAMAGELGLDSVSFEDPVPYQAIPELAAQADAFVLTVLHRPDLYRYGVSMNKLFDYLAGGRPIVLASAAANNPVDEAGAGVTTPPENPAALAEAIRTVAEMTPGERARMGEAGRRHLAENYDYRILAGKLAGVLEQALERSGNRVR